MCFVLFLVVIVASYTEGKYTYTRNIFNKNEDRNRMLNWLCVSEEIFSFVETFFLLSLLSLLLVMEKMKFSSESIPELVPESAPESESKSVPDSHFHHRNRPRNRN